VCFGTAARIPPHVVHNAALAWVCASGSGHRLLSLRPEHNGRCSPNACTTCTLCTVFTQPAFSLLVVCLCVRAVAFGMHVGAKTVMRDGCRHRNNAGETSDVPRGHTHLREDAHFISPGLISFCVWLRNVKTAHAFKRSVWLWLVRSISGHFMRTDAVGYAGQLPALP